MERQQSIFFTDPSGYETEFTLTGPGADAAGSGLLLLAKQLDPTSDARKLVAPSSSATERVVGALGIASLFIGDGAGKFTLKDGEDVAVLGAHGVASMLVHDGVGVSDRALMDALKIPLQTILQSNGRTLLLGKDAAVVIEKKWQSDNDLGN